MASVVIHKDLSKDLHKLQGIVYWREGSIREYRSYINTLIHRVVPGGWIQGGDIVDRSESGGESIYEATFDGIHLIMYTSYI